MRHVFIVCIELTDLLYNSPANSSLHYTTRLDSPTLSLVQQPLFSDKKLLRKRTQVLQCVTHHCCPKLYKLTPKCTAIIRKCI